jgi:hypothetical protein
VRIILEKQFLSADSKERHCAGDLLGVMLMPPGNYLRGAPQRIYRDGPLGSV